ncbi:MAG: TIGR03960 family B12-binding radical SAM protein [Candidatus Omnitrophica bacterium]|nr:TIGR03960 family B12-binding radical SAM protein [Candidatus Omnitrophota bacterium]
MNFANFRKPQRYIGNEWNVIKKSPSGKISFCLCYPDLYELGMSNLGMHIVYGLLNQHPDLFCERTFMPAEDLSTYLREKNKPLFSLETKKPLNEFEIIGFHLGCELNFTNVLHILTLGLIPAKAKDRKQQIVVGGGVANPEPLSEFIDVFYLGEFEEVADDFVKVIRKYKDKESRLRALAEIEGFYVPKFYEVNFVDGGYDFRRKYEYARLPLKRVYVKDLDRAFVPQSWLTPHTEIIHDRIPIEIARGCPNRCSFCQAQALYAPYRERKIATIQNILKVAYEKSGYENFSFLGLSASDYSQIEELIDLCSDYCQNRRIGLSLPSLRASDIVGRLYRKLSKLKKASLTIAIEAARAPLRESLNKRIGTKILFEAAKILKSVGAKSIKIYFMYGFPQENEEDLLAIGEFLKSLSRSSHIKLNVSINAFIPKPFSLAEGFLMQSETVLNKKREVIIKNLPQRSRVSVTFSSIQRSIFEAIVSGSDREFGKVIYRAYSKGVCFDGNRENFSWPTWQESMVQEKVDPKDYLNRQAKNFPWSFINSKP